MSLLLKKHELGDSEMHYCV